MFQYFIHPLRLLHILRIAKEKRRNKKQKRSLQAQRVIEERNAMARIMRFPEKQMTRTEVDRLPGARKPLPDDFLETCALGTWFMCRLSHDRPLVVGQIVERDDLLCDQLGSSICVPKRGINRYRLVTV